MRPVQESLATFLRGSNFFFVHIQHLPLCFEDILLRGGVGSFIKFKQILPITVLQNNCIILLLHIFIFNKLKLRKFAPFVIYGSRNFHFHEPNDILVWRVMQEIERTPDVEDAVIRPEHLENSLIQIPIVQKIKSGDIGVTRRVALDQRRTGNRVNRSVFDCGSNSLFLISLLHRISLSHIRHASSAI